ncbi:MAG TPA: hypothetical protein VMS89_03145 [Methanoregulaceae archaeon]|nr:hypothetical protein [Methanoregulaceae archaeon]
MEFELAPMVSVQTGTFAAVIAPEELMLPALTNPVTRKYLLLYLAGRRSGILPALTVRPETMDVVRLVSPGALTAAVRKARHTIIFVEHDPSLYNCPDDVMPVARSLKAAAGEALVLLYTPKNDTLFDCFLQAADQVYFFRPPPVPPRTVPKRPARARGRPRAADGQVSLNGFTGGVS